MYYKNAMIACYQWYLLIYLVLFTNKTKWIGKIQAAILHTIRLLKCHGGVRLQPCRFPLTPREMLITILA